MNIYGTKITGLDQLKRRDCIVLLVDGRPRFESVKAVLNLGNQTEIIINRKKNLYFNLQMMIEGKSWVSECWKVSAETDPNRERQVNNKIHDLLGAN